MGYIVIFKRLAGIPNVALLVRPMVPSCIDTTENIDSSTQGDPSNFFLCEATWTSTSIK